MMLIITGVGSLILLYSTEYMGRDRDYRRFFAEMSFFVFAMLLLVEAANFLFLIVGWALVGLASYLLIGYYYERPSAVAAAKKAFVVNVIGDVGMVLAAFLLIRELGTLDYGEVFATAPDGLGQGTGVAEAVALLLFVGAAAKSAQIPLHTWLPDAMEGPTPVSALIHAATMVTAGVYMIVRCNVLYELAPYAGDIVAVVGALTLFVAATIAFVQEDIKRVLAWSTVSQIGYMIMAAGLGLYGSSMFHLLTHAFFKALLFLSVGVVIHALADQQSLNRMGGLRRLMPVANLGVLVGCLAIVGIPPFSGFFSKDEIIAGALEAGDLGVVLGIVGIAGAGLTAFYMFRLYFRAFWGPPPEGGYDVPHPHPPGWTMVVPIYVLAVGATFIGWLQVPGGWQLVDDWLEPAMTAAPDIEVSATAEMIASRGQRRPGSRRDRHRLVGLRRRSPPPRAAGRRRARDPRAAARPVPLRRRLRAGGRAARPRPGRRHDPRRRALRRPGGDGGRGPVAGRRGARPARGSERPGARLRLRDDRRRGDPRGHLHAGDAVAARALGLRHRPAAR